MDMDSEEYRRMELSNRNIVRKRYYGVSSIVLLLVTGFIFYLASGMVASGITCAFTPGSTNAGSDIKTGTILGAVGFLSLIVTLACAGASLATAEQSILGALVIGVAMLPFLLFIASVLFDLQLDLSAFSGNSGNAPTTQSVPVKC